MFIEQPVFFSVLHYYIEIIAFLLLNAALVVGYFLQFNNKVLAIRLLYVGVAYTTQIMVVGLLLGLTGLLYRIPYVGIHMLIAAYLLYTNRAQFTELFAANLKIFKVQSIIAKCKAYPQVIVIIGTILFLAWRSFFVGIFNLPSIGDDLFYQIPPIFHWIVTHHISSYPTLVIWQDVYPHNIQLLVLFPTLFFHSDRFILCFNALYVLIGYLIVGYALCVSFSNKVVAWFAGIVLFLFPVVANAVFTGYIDYYINLYVLAAVSVLWIMRTHFNETKLHYALCLIGAITVGAKYSAVYSLVLFVGAYLLLLIHTYFYTGWRPLLRPRIIHICIVVVALFLGGYSYVRNYHVYGNPFAPQKITIAGHELFATHLAPGNFFDQDPAHFKDAVSAKGNYALDTLFEPELVGISIEEKLELLSDTYRDFRPVYILQSRNQLGPFWLYIGLPAALLGLVWAIWRRYWNIVGLLLGIFLLFELQPYYLQLTTRYSSFITAVGAIGIIVLITALRSKWLQALCMVFVLIVAMGPVLSVPLGDSYVMKQARAGFSQGIYHGAIIKDPPANLLCMDFAASRLQNKRIAYINIGPYPYTYSLYGRRLTNQVFYYYELNPAVWKADVLRDHIDIIAVLSPGDITMHIPILEMIKSDSSTFNSLQRVEGVQNDQYDVCRQYFFYQVTQLP